VHRGYDLVDMLLARQAAERHDHWTIDVGSRSEPLKCFWVATRRQQARVDADEWNVVERRAASSRICWAALDVAQIVASTCRYR
jgi:hypothetical protein